MIWSYLKKHFWLLCRNWISRANNGSKEIEETEVIIKYDDGLNQDDSGSGENGSGCVLEVEMAGPCNERGG